MIDMKNKITKLLLLGVLFSGCSSTTSQTSTENTTQEENSNWIGIAGDQYMVVGDEIPAGIYDIRPAKKDDRVSIYIFDNLYNFKAHEENNLENAYDHYENYYSDEDGKGVDGIIFRKGEVIDIGYAPIEIKLSGH